MTSPTKDQINPWYAADRYKGTVIQKIMEERNIVMKNCKHERWLYVNPRDVGIGDNTLYINVNNFLCADCGEWIGMGSIDINKIINVKKEPRETCKHDKSFCTLSGMMHCLRCNFTWCPEPPKLHIGIDTNREERDRLYRKQILDDFSNGKIL